ncbi:MAG: metallophosphoesterase [Promethearchaeota archaeon]
MKIGVMSDSHDHLSNITKAIDFFITEKVGKIIHCGDYVAPFVKRSMKSLASSGIEAIGVFGNNDGERDGLHKILGKTLKIFGDFHELELEDHRIAIYHGTIAKILQNVIHSQDYDLVLTGHTHEVKIVKYQKTLVVNPGETCGYLTGTPTCAVINLSTKILTPESITIVNLSEL